MGAIGEHSRSDAECGNGEEARGDEWDKIDIVGRRATSCVPALPRSPLMNESEHSHLCGWRFL